MSLKIGRVAGIDIKLHYSWFIIFVFISLSLATGYLVDEYPGQTSFFYWSVGVFAATLLFISVLIHEVAHSLVAQRFKIAVGRITLYFLGGVSETLEEAHTPKAELRMAAAGPLTSLGLGALFFIIWVVSARVLPLSVYAVLEYAFIINILLAFFNLIPAFPMDGGRVLRAIIWGRGRDLLSSTRVVTRVSKVISFIFFALGLTSMLFTVSFDGLWLLIIGVFINGSADASLSETRFSVALSGVTVGEIMTRDVHTIEPGITLQQAIDYHFTPLKHHGFPVLSNGELVGLVAEEDVRKVPIEKLDEVTVDKIMKPLKDLISAKPNEAAMDAFIKMAKAGIGRLPVIEEGKLVGIITRSDFSNAVQKRLSFRS